MAHLVPRSLYFMSALAIDFEGFFLALGLSPAASGVACIFDFDCSCLLDYYCTCCDFRTIGV